MCSTKFTKIINSSLGPFDRWPEAVFSNSPCAMCQVGPLFSQMSLNKGNWEACALEDMPLDTRASRSEYCGRFLVLLRACCLGSSSFLSPFSEASQPWCRWRQNHLAWSLYFLVKLEETEEIALPNLLFFCLWRDRPRALRDRVTEWGPALKSFSRMFFIFFSHDFQIGSKDCRPENRKVRDHSTSLDWLEIRSLIEDGQPPCIVSQACRGPLG